MKEYAGENTVENQYLRNLNRIEFVITLACTGRCKHCSEGDHASKSEYIDAEAAQRAVYRLCSHFPIDSLMTFGGEPLLHLEEVCRIHTAAKEMNIPKRQLITNGFFSTDKEYIRKAALSLAESGINNVLLSVDAFHQETIPLEYAKQFARSLSDAGVWVRTNPAWLVDPEAENPYNLRTREILKEFTDMGISASEGNIIFPAGNALKYLQEYFDPNEKYLSPYEEDPKDVRAICISPNGDIDVLGGNIYQRDILDIIREYKPD